MRIFVTGDLHWDEEMYEMERQLADSLSRKIENENPDVVVITGDVFETMQLKSPYKLLDRYLPDLPIVCVTGNHEFLHHDPEHVYKKYEEMYNPKYNVHYLDVCGNFYMNIGNVNFFGNTLWYDGSLKTCPGQNLYDWANGMWADKFIKNFDPVELNKRCVEQYKKQLLTNTYKNTNILVTHHIPHRDLNGHLQNRYIGSPFDAYSGVDNLFLKAYAKPDYALCGHTHLRVLEELSGVYCINAGNDYMETRYEILDI